MLIHRVISKVPFYRRGFTLSKPCAKCRLWAALSPSPHPIFADFVCPLVSRSERRIVELRILFFHSIWKLSRRRRFSSQPLEPITEAELEELRGSIQGCTGRLVSL
ncbi:BQ2448_1970 [Microbotryum intermedium]|uniref:BQ2448_1970 protein n=1 Tax=Microbotryum intermedium TaxID=269621 RepID=A0A238F4S4_9BASI|nr:BQ2448_1970 [Microbotryum intermedium]